MKNRLIALMSDWGLNDGSVGAVKGVILGINPRANIVDMSHEVQSWDIKQGAFLLMAHYNTFPKGTIFVVVIDPGVGTKRKAILVETVSGYYFLGPDNGVLSWALAGERIRKVINVTNEVYFRKPVSSAFHGRDIFAPVAAYLSKGVPVTQFGEEIESYRKRGSPMWNPDIVNKDYPLKKKGNQLIGEVLFIDKFGNLITSVRKETLTQIPVPVKELNIEIKVGQAIIRKLSHTYEDGKEKGEALAFFGGDFGDLLDIAVYKGSAAENLGVKVGDKITIERKQ